MKFLAACSARAIPLLPVASLLIVWWYVSASGWYPTQLLVPPFEVWAAFREMLASGELQEHLRVSLHRLAFGMLVGCSLGIVAGVLVGLSRTAEEYIAPTFHVVRQVPSIALIPVLILIFGIGDTFKVLIVTKAALFPVWLATYTAVQGISRSQFDVAAVYRLPRSTLFFRIVLPATLPPVLTGVRLALGRSWGALVAAELLAAESGLGQMMELGRQMFRIDVVMVGVVLTGLIGFVLDRLLRLAELRFGRWRTTY
jgi:sulfonate transport system permease protein